MNIDTFLAKRRQLTATAAVVAAALIAGTAYAASTSVTASSTDNVVTRSSGTTLSTTGGTLTPVITVALPSSTNGTHYVLAAQGDLVNFGPSDFTRCILVVNGSQVAGVSTMVGDPTASGARGPSAILSPFSLTGGANVPAAGATAVLKCSHDVSNGATPYVDAGASLSAHRTTSLKIASE
jgi:hypothetical protein